MSENTKSYASLGDSSGASTAKPLIWNSELIQRFWNHHSRSEESYFASQFGEAVVQTLWRHLQGRIPILDYGCGTGALTGYLLSRGLHVAVYDVSEYSLSIVTQKFGQHEKFLGTVSPATLSDHAAYFDAVLLVEIIEHVDDAELTNIFNNVKHVLVPNGLVIVTTPNEEDLLANTVYCPVCNHTFHRWQHIRSWSAGSLRQTFHQHGLEEVEIFSTDFSLSPRDGSLRYLTKKFISHLTRRRQPHLVGVARMLKI